jgi:hypothetical protein
MPSLVEIFRNAPRNLDVRYSYFQYAKRHFQPRSGAMNDLIDELQNIQLRRLRRDNRRKTK